MSDFRVSNGQIIDPAGNVFRKRGINVYWLGNTPQQLCGDTACTKLLADFPGLNAVRVVCENGYTLAGLEPYVTRMTDLGIVVTICDFNISPGKPAPTGAALAAQVAWYKLIAQTYKDNERVWPESQNELYDTGSVMAASHKLMYDAVRSVAPTKIVVIGHPGGGNPGTVGVRGRVNGSPMTPAVYAAMTGIVFDLHAYAWMVKRTTPAIGDSTNIAAIQEIIRGSVDGAYGVRAAQTLLSRDGIVPVYIGEFGNSTTGLAADPNGVQLVEAVATMPATDTSGWIVFAAGTANVGVRFFNALTDDNSNLTDPYGIQGQRLVKAASQAVVVVQPLVFTESVNNTVITKSSDPAIVGSTGERWTLTAGGQVAINGVADITTRNVVSLAYVNHLIWQQSTSGSWWGKTVSTGAWSPPTGTATSPLPVVPVFTESPDNTVINKPADPAIIGSTGEVWTLTAGGQVAVNGVTDLSTQNAISMAYVAHQVWHQNANHLWWAKTLASDSWSPNAGTATSPLPETGQSPEGAKVISPSTDALNYDGSLWTIVDGKVLRDGANPLSTANVVQIEVFAGAMWHKNTSSQWYRWPTSANWTPEPMAVPAN